MYLHHPQTLRAVALAQDGALGRLELVQGTFSFYLTYPGDPRVEPTMGGGSLWDVGCYPVSLARRIAGEEPDRVSAFARFDERGVDRTFIGQLHFPGGLLAQFDSGFAAPDASGSRSSAGTPAWCSTRRSCPSPTARRRR